jgi:lysyl-tRNA synthetase class 2
LEVQLAGRVLASDGLNLVVADAFASVEVELERSSAVEVGDLVVLAGRPEQAQLRAARLIERYTPARPPGRDDPPGRDETSGGENSPIKNDHNDDDAPPANETARFIHRGVGQALVARSVAIAAIRRFFGRERFLEVDTPLMVPSPGLDLHLDAFEVGGGAFSAGATHTAGGAASPPRFLITSPEYQMKRLLAGGVPRCFQLARCFRRGELGHHHNPEFLMLEWYRAFAGVDQVMDDTERLVRLLAEEVIGAESIDVGGPEGGVRVDLAAPFERLTVSEAFARHAGVGGDEAIDLATSDESRFFKLLVDLVEPALARAPRPVFLVDYPAPFASLARHKPSDPRLCERFELYLGGVEICNGFGELTDPVEQRARLEHDQKKRAEIGKPVYPIDERFLAALEEGIPPSAGNALGVDRLIALLIGADRIATVQPFPADWL